MTRKIRIFDTTLRDGEQSPGAAMDTQEKLKIARQLLRLNVDVIEAGFPASSPGDFASVRQIATEVGDKASVCALTRAVASDIRSAGEALAGAARPRIQTGLGVSPVHLQDKLRMSEDDALDSAVKAIKLAKQYTSDVQFYAEDAGRANMDFLMRIVKAAISAGATVVNIPDTTGFLLPIQFGKRIRTIYENIDEINSGDVILSVHCHNDLGLATALSLAGIAAGATEVDCTINGIGERAGNAALEEVVEAIALHGDELDAHTSINTQELVRTSRLVSQITGLKVQHNKAIVGRNAFAHSSGIHQDGILKERSTYEIIDPASVGAGASELVLTARSGRAALRDRLGKLGFTLDDETFQRINERFLEIADKKSEVYDEDLEALMAEYDRAVDELWTLKILQVSCGTPLIATATVVLTDANGAEHNAVASGTGPVDATYRAIQQVIAAGTDTLLRHSGTPLRHSGLDPESTEGLSASTENATHAVEVIHDMGDLQEFSIQAITRGIDALGEVLVRVADKDGHVFTGRGADGDVIVSAAKAYINALNRLLRYESEHDHE
ncbi:MAG: 2-isopropylmalate synthase [Coriobacteriales bacterium]|jgi:2-isopropylmalate synthase|nr:2-isopropylmalate synthase [Coriobacteriales bacterium]